MNIADIIIPEEIRDVTLPTPEELNYWYLRDQRTYWIDFEIEEDYRLIELAKEIILINEKEKSVKNPKPIVLYIYSYGGDIEQANFFCDLILSSHVPIITVATGVAMSAGLLIFLAGHRRYAFPHTQLLIHSGSAAFSGTSEQLEQAQKSYKKQIDSMKDYILERTKIDEKLFNKQRTKDWYVSGQEIIDLGLADRFITSFSDIK